MSCLKLLLHEIWCSFVSTTYIYCSNIPEICLYAQFFLSVMERFVWVFCHSWSSISLQHKLTKYPIFIVLHCYVHFKSNKYSHTGQQQLQKSFQIFGGDAFYTVWEVICRTRYILSISCFGRVEEKLFDIYMKIILALLILIEPWKY